MKRLIKDRIENFWGYGNSDSDIWFVGMEEGFDGTLGDLTKRLENTYGKNFIDLKDDMKNIPDHYKWFMYKPELQPTWSKLILILLTLQNKESIDNEEIRDYQLNEFGRNYANHSIIELMPLPSKSINKKDWIYDKFNIASIHSRKEYMKNFLDKRIYSLRSLITKQKPKIVVFFSLSYLNHWKKITNTNLHKINDLYFGNNEHSTFFVIPHPTAHGFTKKRWRDIANFIKTNSKY